MGPASHLAVALQTQHPFSRPPQLEPHIEFAISMQPSPDALMAQRKRCCAALAKLCAALEIEWSAWLLHVHVDIRPIVGRRMVPFCREVSVITQSNDVPLWSDYVNGLPMAGWACHSLALPPKITVPTASLLCISAVDPPRPSSVLVRWTPAIMRRLLAVSSQLGIRNWTRRRGKNR